MSSVFTATTVDGETFTLIMDLGTVIGCFAFSLVISWLIGKFFTDEKNPLLKNIDWPVPQSTFGTCLFMLLVSVGTIGVTIGLIWWGMPLAGQLLAVFMPGHATTFYVFCLLFFPLIIWVSNTAFYIVRRSAGITVDTK